MKGVAQIEIGTRLTYAGQSWKIIDRPAGELVRLQSSAGIEISASWVSIINSPDFKVDGDEEAPTQPYHAAFTRLPANLRQQAAEREAHVLEMLTGCRSLEGEMNPLYAPKQWTLTQRLERKAEELKSASRYGGCSVSSVSQLKRWIASYRDLGIYGLVDRRHLRGGQQVSQIDQELIEVIRRVASRRVEDSDTSFTQIRLEIKSEWDK